MTHKCHGFGECGGSCADGQCIADPACTELEDECTLLCAVGEILDPVACICSEVVCEAGYYNDGVFCMPCPEDSALPAPTSSGDSSGITSCYIPSGSTYSDNTGNIEFTGNCNYLP